MEPRRTSLLRTSTLDIGLFACFLLLVDIFMYGLMLPVAGTFLASYFCNALGLGMLSGMVLAIATVFGMLYGIYSLKLEVEFWRHLFAMENVYSKILMCRDAVNFVCILGNLIWLYRLLFHIEDDVDYTKPPAPLQGYDEGIVFVIQRKLAWLGMSSDIKQMDEPEGYWEYLWNWLRVIPGENAKDLEMIYGAQVLLAVGGLTASITKLLYFTTLYTFLMAEKIFVDIQETSSVPSLLKFHSPTTSEYISDFSIPAEVESHTAHTESTRRHYEYDPVTKKARRTAP